jgi:DNA adenine methylase
MSLQPFLKWAGGKRWLIYSAPELFSQNYNNFFEPFLGSGAVLFYLQPKRAYISDLNKELINAYIAIRDDYERVVCLLKIHQSLHSREYYYKVRESNPNTAYEKTARFIYLNRTCWNGLYRVNKEGNFNVPIGTKTNVILDTDDFESISRFLKSVNLNCCDFEETISKADKGDLIFVDPPYAVSHLNNGFLKYNEKLFSWSDQERLAKCLILAKKRGAFVIATNAHHECVKDLYKDEFTLNTFTRSSLISGKNIGRKKTKELLILS